MKRNLTSLSAIISAGLLVTGCASTSEPPPERTVLVAQPNKTVEAMVEVQALRGELSRLRNELEIQSNEMEKLKRRQRELYDDLDLRLRSQESGMSTNTGSVGYTPAAQPSFNTGGTNTAAGIDPTMAPSVGVQGTTGSSGATDISLGSSATGVNTEDLSINQTQTQDTARSATGGTGVVTNEIAVGAAATAPGSSGATTGSTSVAANTPGTLAQDAISSTAEQDAYDAAFNLLKQSRYAESVAAFQQMVITYPKGALADDAQYWIGEAMYVTRDFQGALRSFQTVVNKYPESQRVPEAMLKLGYIQYEVGAKEDARRTLTEVVNRYPGSRVAISAQTRLRKLQSEGG